MIKGIAQEWFGTSVLRGLVRPRAAQCEKTGVGSYEQAVRTLLISPRVQAIAGIVGASGLQILLLAILSLLLARVLTIEDFGITRIVTAYMVVLTMFGHVCMHDAVSSFVARAATMEEKSEYVTAGSKLVVISSSIVVAAFQIIVFSGPWWTGRLQSALAAVALLLPVLSLTLVYTAVLQSIGSHKRLGVAVLLGGVIPLVCILPFSSVWSLTGWIVGRGLSYLLLLFVGVFLVREFLRVVRVSSAVYARLRAFARVQIVSGILSMCMQSADILILERFGASLSEVAMYGLAALFARSILFVPGALGRVYFRELAEGAMGRAYEKPAIRLLSVVSAVSIILSVLIAVCVPLLVERFYGVEYLGSVPILRVMCVGIAFNGLWSALSTINTAINKPSFAVAMSVGGVCTSIAFLVMLIPTYGSIGAAWAMNAAYAAGTAIGLWLLYSKEEHS